MSGRSKVVLKRGAGQSLRWLPWQGDESYRGTPFPNALATSEDDAFAPYLLPMTTLREFAMLRFINSVTDKPEWTHKVFEQGIIEKWRGEIVTPENDFTLNMFEYCTGELQDLAQRFPGSPNGAIKVYNGDVYKSDVAVPLQTKLALQQAVRTLEDVPDHHKDWHPGSNGQVLDLVHPSLFPLIYGRTKILKAGSYVTDLEDCIKRCGEGEVLHLPKPRFPDLVAKDDDILGGFSKSFQWLPCEVDISGDKPKIMTYINNLHPQKYRDLYSLVEDVINAALPLWSLTLAPLRESTYRLPQRIAYKCRYDPDPESWPDSEQIQPLEGESESDFGERKWQWWEDTRRVMLPEPPEVYERLKEPKAFSLKDSFAPHPLQIIVKLANIHLTPEKPEYEGGTWHVEGTMNEAICATALYYYSCENTMPSKLSFRQISDQDDTIDMLYRQDQHDWIRPVFGLEQGGAPVQFVGSIETREGRLITFPNILHHQVQPFKLADPTKPGHRKLLALFLVDPNVPGVISTADIPCQRLDWWSEEISSRSSNANGLGKLPAELRENVFQAVEDFPLSLDIAKTYRLQLMEERKKFVLAHERYLADGLEISLCEH